MRLIFIFIRKRLYDRPIPVWYNKMSDEGLWGGEGLVIGLRTKRNNPMKPRYLALFFVICHKSVKK